MAWLHKRWLVDDLERAHALLKPLTDPNDKTRYAMMVASAAMKDDPSLPPRVRMQIAYRLGATDPAAAVRIVDSIQEDDRESAKIKAEAFSWVAVAVAPKDKKLAYSLIDRSLAIYVDEPEKLRSSSNFGAPSVFAARVAGLAHEIGYPDMDSVIARVLALRTDQPLRIPGPGYRIPFGHGPDPGAYRLDHGQANPAGSNRAAPSSARAIARFAGATGCRPGPLPICPTP